MELSGVIEGFYGRPWTTKQRLELFDWMAAWGMNSYMYGPKDDLKMRAAWRELYTEAELAELIQLHNQCQLKEISFIYTIAPGLDVRYADETELSILKRKMDQLLAHGVEHFCILFDDIPFNMTEIDAAKFGSFAQAQAYLSNEVFVHIRQQTQGLFLFCPTEYCGRMAKPSVKDSSYLRELGDLLDPDIDIFWTGPEIVSEEISLDSILELQKVLKRKPLIWDNLHANDYDIRRIYLGPFAGRSVKLKQELRGVLSNPNNEFEANYIPLRTLGRYANDNSYEVKTAYQDALKEWLKRFETHGKETISLAELELLADLFYLFFEHGNSVKALLLDVRIMLSSEPQSWGNAFLRLEQTSKTLSHLFRKLTELENRDLLYSLYNYVWEIEHAIRYLHAYLDWVRQGNKGSEFGRPAHLANTFRTGLTAELERLMPLNDIGKVSL